MRAIHFKELGEKAKRFTNVFIKNFGDDLSEEDLTNMFAKFGKIASLKVRKDFHPLNT